MESDDDDTMIAETVKYIITQMILVHKGTNEDPHCTAVYNIKEESFYYLAHNDEDEESTVFTTHLQDTAFSHATLTVLLKKRFWNTLHDILVDTGAA